VLQYFVPELTPARSDHIGPHRSICTASISSMQHRNTFESSTRRVQRWFVFDSEILIHSKIW
jgi:hypothetical protein